MALLTYRYFHLNCDYARLQEPSRSDVRARGENASLVIGADFGPRLGSRKMSFFSSLTCVMRERLFYASLIFERMSLLSGRNQGKHQSATTDAALRLARCARQTVDALTAADATKVHAIQGAGSSVRNWRRSSAKAARSAGS